MFQQVLNPAHNLALTALLSILPFVVLLALLAWLRTSVWVATLIGSAATLRLALTVWRMPPGVGLQSYLFGGLTGAWAIDWITFWGVVIFNALNATGLFEVFKNWLVARATPDIRVQTILLAWSLGALLEG